MMYQSAAVALLFCVFLTTAAPGPATRPFISGMTDQQIVEQMDAITEKHDLTGMKELAAMIEEDFEKTDPERYARLFLRMSNELATFDFKDDRSLGSSSDLALRALAKQNYLTLSQAARLPGHLRHDMDAAGPLDATHRVVLRMEQAEAWLSIYQRMSDAASTKVDVNYRPFLNIAVPGFEDVIPGASPSVIADPQRRRTYEFALETERKRGQAYFDHQQATNLIGEYSAHLIKFFGSAFANPRPDNQQLNLLYDKYKIEPSLRAEIARRLDQEITPATRNTGGERK